MVSVCGPHKNVLGLSPPFTLTRDEADQIVRLLKESLDEVQAEAAAAAAAATAAEQSKISILLQKLTIQFRVGAEFFPQCRGQKDKKCACRLQRLHFKGNHNHVWWLCGRFGLIFPDL